MIAKVGVYGGLVLGEESFRVPGLLVEPDGDLATSPSSFNISQFNQVRSLLSQVQEVDLLVTHLCRLLVP